MNTIGIRAEPRSITFVVYDTTANTILNAEKIKIPQALTVPEGLKYIRINLIDVLREYNIQKAGVRATESNSQTLSISRLQLEGVILETLCSVQLQKYFCGQIASISKLLNIDRSDFKKYIDGTLDFSSVQNWDSLNKIEREACFAALGVANA